MHMFSAYAAFKLDVGTATGLAPPSLHLQAGILIFLATALVLRKPLWSPLPLGAVIIFELVNELIDRIGHGSWRWPDTQMDLMLTLSVPLALFVAALLRRVTRTA